MNFGVTLMLRFGAKSTFLEKNYALQPRVSVLLPCFNEGEHVFRTIESILASDYPMEKVDVIAVDDCSADDTFEWIERAARRWKNVRAFRNPVNSGKHQTLSHALSHSSRARY
ncbi:glycosyltransferase [Paraburkholderia sp. OAS925]|uniref:glycosyltransferase n=1 Tax=Paraburkholderia sp. OAS925 TaxID=2663827 RepID=UPI00366BF084